MPVKPTFNPDYLYFITTNAVNHYHLFRLDSTKRIIVDSLHFLRTSGRMELFVFVVMPNHIHMIARFSQAYKPADMMRDFKRYTARLILREFQAKGNEKILMMLREANPHRRQKYKIWQDDYDARDVFSIEFLQQKMDYIHMNPSQQHWHLVDDPADYLWSSAGFYMADRMPIIPVDDVRDLFV